MEMVIGPRTGLLSPDDLAWAYPWPAEGRWVRAMMVTTLDGAPAGPDGRSGSISSPADRAVLVEARRLSDVVLIGAGTLRAERYNPMRAKPADAAERERLDLAPAPVVAVVSASLDLPWSDPFFSESAVSPIVVTVDSVEDGRLRAAREHAHVIALPGSSVRPDELIRALESRGLTRIVCEGGPRLLAGLSGAGLIDEADISISPLLTSGGQVLAGTPSAAPAELDLVHVMADSGFLFTRYLARRADAAVSPRP